LTTWADREFDLDWRLFPVTITDGPAAARGVERLPELSLLRLSQNVGCVLAHNLALDFAAAYANGNPYEVVLVDTDVEIHAPAWLAEVRQWVWLRPVGIVGLEHSRAEVCAGAVFLDPQGYWYIHPGQTHQAVPVEAESVGLGWAWLSSAVCAAGLRFDTGYQWYYKQDDDLCFEVRRRGWEVWAYPAAGVHWGSGALRVNDYQVSGDIPDRAAFDAVKRRNQEYFARKWTRVLRARRRDLSAEAAHLTAIKDIFSEETHEQ
jgi:GT2 family glycosyltransferase